MELKIKVRTPKGQAKVTSERIDIKHLLLLGTRARILHKYVNEENDTFIWVVDVPPKYYMKLQRNISYFTVGTTALLKKIANSKLVKKFIKDKGQEEELNKMLEETQIEFYKSTDQQEVVDEITKETKWERVKRNWEEVKEKFKGKY